MNTRPRPVPLMTADVNVILSSYLTISFCQQMYSLHKNICTLKPHYYRTIMQVHGLKTKKCVQRCFRTYIIAVP